MTRYVLPLAIVALSLSCASSGGQAEAPPPAPSSTWCATAVSPEIAAEQMNTLFAIEGLYDEDTKRQMRDSWVRYRRAYRQCQN